VKGILFFDQNQDVYIKACVYLCNADQNSNYKTQQKAERIVRM